MSACGGANNGTNSSANDSTNNKAVDFPLYSAEGLTNGSSALELTPEQLANATQSLQAFEQSSQTQTNVNGFIVKYKNDDSSVVGASDIVGTATETLIRLLADFKSDNNKGLCIPPPLKYNTG